MSSSVETVIFGNKATLTAVPGACCYFDHWEEKGKPCVVVSKENPYTFEVIDDIEYVAVFNKRRFSVHITSDLPDYVCIEGEGEYDCGDTVKITAIANECFSIRWSDEQMNLVGDSETKNGKTTIRYTIESIENDFYAHVVMQDGICNVTVTPCDSSSGNAFIFYSDGYSQYNTLTEGCHTFDNISSDFDICDFIEGDCITANSVDFLCGDIVTLVAEPNEGCKFLGWKVGDCSSCGFGEYISDLPVYTTVVNGDENYVACFECEQEHPCVPIRFKSCALYEIEYNGEVKYVYGAKHGTYPRVYELKVPYNSRVTIYFWTIDLYQRIYNDFIKVNGNIVGQTETFFTRTAWSVGDLFDVDGCNFHSECMEEPIGLVKIYGENKFILHKFVINNVTENELNIDIVEGNTPTTQWSYNMPIGGVWNGDIYEYAGLYATCEPNIFGCQRNQE